MIEEDGVDESGINQWNTLKYTGTPPRQRSLHVGIVLGDALYVFGGYDGSNRVNDFYKFDFKRSKWSQIHTTTAPSARDRHVCLCHKESIYIFGGYDGNNRVNDFWQYDSVLNQWSQVEVLGGQPPTPRHSHAGIEYGGSTYIFAGYDGNYRSDFHEFDFSTKRWSLVAVKGHTPKARYRTSAAAYKNKMLVIGGHDGQKHLNDFYEFDFSTLTWHDIEPEGNVRPSPRDSHSACIYGDSLYLFGGSTGSARNDLYEFRFDTKAWREIRPSASSASSSSAGSSPSDKSPNAKDNHQPPCPRFCHTGVIYNSCLYIFGGYDGQNRLNDFKGFRLADEVHVEIPAPTIIQDLRRCLNEPKFSDITFVLDDGRHIYAHKLLCMRCSYFRAMFEGPMIESQLKEIKIVNTSHDVFMSLLEYLYTDEIEIKLDMAMDLFVAADQYGVDRLKKLCEKKILVSINIENAATILQAANMHHAHGLRQSCLDFILSHFDVVSKTASFDDMGRNNVELLLEILKRR